MIVLAFLQNSYFQNPDEARDLFRRHPDQRNWLVKKFLFMGCLTGKRLESAFGEKLCQEIIWEETSPEIGGHSSSKFKPDIQHITRSIVKHKPDLVLAFGSVALNGVMRAMPLLAQAPVKFELLSAPHPAARDNPMPALRELAEQVRTKVAA